MTLQADSSAANSRRRGEKPPYAEFDKTWGNAHPITFSDAELAHDVSHLTLAAPIQKKEKPAETAEHVKA